MPLIEAKESLIGVRLEEGRLLRTTQHRTGEVESEICTPSPHAHQPQTVGALRRRNVAGLSRTEHVERSVRVEAALLKGMSAATGKRINDDRLARAVLVEVLAAMGGEWRERAGGVMGL